jgi:hypothetical protein
MRRIDIDDPEVDTDGSGCLSYEGEPFTGEVAERFGVDMISLGHVCRRLQARAVP